MTQYGFGKVDITPALGTELQGFGPFRRRRATEVRGRLFARAVAVRDGEQRWVLVSCDLVSLSEDLVRNATRLISEATGWARSEIALHATHTHSGPATGDFVGWGEPDPLYNAMLACRLAEVCTAAIADLADGTVSFGEAPLTGFAYNRMRPSPGRSNEAGLAGTWASAEPELIDQTVEVLRVDRDGALRGFLVSYSCHPVICSEETSALHGDFAGEALSIVEQQNPAAVGVFLQGAMGDINPTFAHAPPAQSFEALRVYAERFARAVSSALESHSPMVDGPVACSLGAMDYALPPLDRSELDERLRRAEAEIARGDIAAPTPAVARAGAHAVALRRIIDVLERDGDIRRPIWIQTLRLGDFVISCTNLELFHSIKRQVRSEVGRHCWVLSTTNGYLGYAPAAYAYEPGYKAYAAFEVPYFVCLVPFTSDIAEHVTVAVVDGIRSIRSAG